jgi:NAD(P)-dependent dehydrogenase (short-subunit alcohol dehydrogenase family)
MNNRPHPNPTQLGEGVKTIVITGATGALGSLAAKTFAGLGHNLALLDKDSEKLDSLVRDLNLPANRLSAQTVDLLDAAALQTSAEAVLSKFGSVHALFHLVGGWVGGKTFVDASHDDLEFMLNQHVRTTFNLFKVFSPALSANGLGTSHRHLRFHCGEPARQICRVHRHQSRAGEHGAFARRRVERLKVTANIIQVRAIDVENKGTGTTPAEIVSAMEYLFSTQADKINGARIPLY